MFKTTIDHNDNLVYLHIDRIIEDNKSRGECSLIFFPNSKTYMTLYITLNNMLIDYLSENRMVNIIELHSIKNDKMRSGCKLEICPHMLMKLI